MNDEINLIVTENPGSISLKNFEEVKVNVSNFLSKYNDTNYVLEQLEDAKKDRKELRILRKKITDKKRELKLSYLAPYEEFEEKINELINMIDIPLKKIDNFIKEEELIVKSMRLEEYINERGQVLGNHLEKIKNSPAFYNPRWKNSSYNVVQIKREIDQKISRAASDLQAIKLSQNKNASALMAHYYETLSLERSFDFLDSIENDYSNVDLNIDEVQEYKIIKIKGTATQLKMIINHMKKINIDYEILEEEKE